MVDDRLHKNFKAGRRVCIDQGLNSLGLVVFSTVLLAASAQNSCTALVFSCYVPSRSFSNKGEESSSKKRSSAEKRSDGVMEDVGNNNETKGQNKSKCGTTNGAHIESINLKSNLKKTTIVEAENQVNTTQKRKVTWPDAHGKDIAQVQEFEPSVAEEGDLEGVRNSCVCAIQ